MERHAPRRRRIATATGVVAVAALAFQAAAGRRRTRAHAPVPRAAQRTLTPRPEQPAAPSTTWQPSPPSHLVRRRGRQSRIATLVAVVFVLSGLALIGVAVGSQQPAPAAPPLTVAAAEPTQIQTLKPAPAHVPEPHEAWRRAGMSAAQQPAPSREEQQDGARNSVAPESAAGDLAAGAAAPLDSSKPATIAIPAIGVHSVVRHLGQAANGSLEVPSGAQYNDAGWYRHSPTPGALGPAVVLGHVDSAAQGPSVFFRLGELRRGHRVTITRADGSVAVFVVDAVHRYAKKDFPTKVVYSDIDHAGLRILTCGGAFDDAAGSYLDNIVVFASLVGSKA